MFSARRWLQVIKEALRQAEEVLDDEEFDALLRAVEQEMTQLKNVSPVSIWS